MDILCDALMDKLRALQAPGLKLCCAGSAAGLSEMSDRGCRNQCSGSCEGDCEGSCDSTCYGGCEGSFGYE